VSKMFQREDYRQVLIDALNSARGILCSFDNFRRTSGREGFLREALRTPRVLHLRFTRTGCRCCGLKRAPDRCPKDWGRSMGTCNQQLRQWQTEAHSPRMTGTGPVILAAPKGGWY
jgi:hypothetical protein